MTSQSDDTQQHPTLELFIHDQGGNAPESNRETAAIELDSTSIAPQVAFHTAPETWYSSCAPEVVESLKSEDRKEVAFKSAYTHRLSKTKIFTTLALCVAVAIAVGVGVGLSRKKSSISKAQQGHPYRGTILEGSSLAALAQPNGDRRLFFQNRDGAIIQALFQVSENNWNTEVVVASKARYHTPISAISFKDEISESLYLFYIDNFSRLIIAEFPIAQGGWSLSYDWLVAGKDNNFTTVSANASSLSATSVSGSGRDTHISVLYENSNGDMIMLRGTLHQGFFEWCDISPQLRSAAPESMLRSPFYSGGLMPGGPELIVTKTAKHDLGIFTSWSLIPYQNNTFGLVSTVELTAEMNLTLVYAHDGAAYLLSIDKLKGNLLANKLDHKPLFKTSPKGNFPFSKLAAIGTDQSDKYYVYHQTNNLSIAEDIWDPNLRYWTNGTCMDYDK